MGGLIVRVDRRGPDILFQGPPTFIYWFKEQMTTQSLVHGSVARILAAPKIAQRTEAWYEFRRIRLTASDASKVLAKGAGKSRLSLFLEKTGQKDSFGGNEATESGAANESNALEEYKRMHPDLVVYDDLSAVVHEAHDELAASLDAVTSCGINVELKTIHGIQMKSIPKTYRDQVLFQMEVCNLDVSHLVQFYVDRGETVVETIHRDPGWFSENLDKFLTFVREVRAHDPVGLFDLENVLHTRTQMLIDEELGAMEVVFESDSASSDSEVSTA